MVGLLGSLGMGLEARFGAKGLLSGGSGVTWEGSGRPGEASFCLQVSGSPVLAVRCELCLNGWNCLCADP